MRGVKKSLFDMTEDVQYNKSCLQKMVQALMDSQGLGLASTAHKIILEVMEAVQKGANKFRKLQQGADCLQSGSEMGTMAC